MVTVLTLLSPLAAATASVRLLVGTFSLLTISGEYTAAQRQVMVNNNVSQRFTSDSTHFGVVTAQI